MKRILLLAVALLCAEEEQARPSYWDFHPVHAGGQVIAIAPANIDQQGGPDQGSLLFNKASVFTSIAVPISEKSIFFPRVEWNIFTMNWDQNPRFTETRFQYVQLALTFFTMALDRWRWIMRAGGNFNVAHFGHFSEYGLFDALLWGMYEMNDAWHCHIGAFGYTGMEGSQVYPIIGFDYAWSKKWSLEAVFPMYYAINYMPHAEWRYSIRGRPLKERFRTSSNQSIFSYSTMGLEANVRYEKFLRCEAEIYAGYNFGGSFYIKDSSNGNALYTGVQGALYGGAALNWGF